MPTVPAARRRPEAAIFDLGDTLLRWTTGPTELQQAAKDLGSPLTMSEAAALWTELHAKPATSAELGLGAGWSPHRYLRALQDYYAPADDHALGLAEWLARCTITPARYRPFLGARELVRDLARAGVKLGVVSDTGFDIRPCLRDNGLTDLQSHLVLSHEVGACKPDASLFAHACDLMNVEPGRTVMIGDNPEADGGSVAAGVTALILPVLDTSLTRDYTLVRSLFGLTS